jgi:phage antirepressor YoqD-like protein
MTNNNGELVKLLKIVNTTITTKLVESIASVDENVKSKLMCYVEMPMNLTTIIETKSPCNNGKTTQI